VPFGTDNQIAGADKRPLYRGRGLFSSQSPFCSVFLLAFSPTMFFSWQRNWKILFAVGRNGGAQAPDHWWQDSFQTKWYPAMDLTHGSRTTRWIHPISFTTKGTLPQSYQVHGRSINGPQAVSDNRLLPYATG